MRADIFEDEKAELLSAGNIDFVAVTTEVTAHISSVETLMLVNAFVCVFDIVEVSVVA